MFAVWQAAHDKDAVTPVAWHAAQDGPPGTPCSVATLGAWQPEHGPPAGAVCAASGTGWDDPNPSPWQVRQTSDGVLPGA
jgi:hypothetical protein